MLIHLKLLNLYPTRIFGSVTRDRDRDGVVHGGRNQRLTRNYLAEKKSANQPPACRPVHCPSP